jgi:hypothetical protein
MDGLMRDVHGVAAAAGTAKRRNPRDAPGRRRIRGGRGWGLGGGERTGKAACMAGAERCNQLGRIPVAPFIAAFSLSSLGASCLPTIGLSAMGEPASSTKPLRHAAAIACRVTSLPSQVCDGNGNAPTRRSTQQRRRTTLHSRPSRLIPAFVS